MLKEEGVIFLPIVNHKMTYIGRLKNALKHIIKNRNLNYNNAIYAKNLFIKSKLDIKAVISTSSSYCDIYILKNATN